MYLLVITEVAQSLLILDWKVCYYFENLHFVLRISGITGLGYQDELFVCRRNQTQLLFGDFGDALGRF